MVFASPLLRRKSLSASAAAAAFLRLMSRMGMSQASKPAALAAKDLAFVALPVPLAADRVTTMIRLTLPLDVAAAALAILAAALGLLDVAAVDILAAALDLLDVAAVEILAAAPRLPSLNQRDAERSTLFPHARLSTKEYPSTLSKLL